MAKELHEKELDEKEKQQIHTIYINVVSAEFFFAMTNVLYNKHLL